MGRHTQIKIKLSICKNKNFRVKSMFQTIEKILGAILHTTSSRRIHKKNRMKKPPIVNLTEHLQMGNTAARIWSKEMHSIIHNRNFASIMAIQRRTVMAVRRNF